MSKKNQNKVSDAVVFVGNIVKDVAIDALRESLEPFLDKEDKANTHISDDKLESILFEHIEAGKSNVDAAEKDTDLEAKNSSIQDRGTDPVESAKAEIVISSIRNMKAYIEGNIDEKEAVKNVAKDSIKGYVDGIISVGMRNASKKIDVKMLSKSHVATAIASAIIDTGDTIYRYGKGEISEEETMKRLGETGFSNLSAIYVGSAAGAIFGAPAAVLGSIAGYMLATSVYQSCITIIQEAQLAEKEAERIENICMEAAKAAMKQREEFKAAIGDYLSSNQAIFDECFQTIEEALNADHPITAIQALSNLTIRFGKKLQLTDFEDFDEFMIESDKPLVL